jgi:hypothetical protein
LPAAVLLSLFVWTPVSAQINLNGMFQNYNAVQTTGENEFIAARNRFRLQLNQSGTAGRFYGEPELIHRYAENQEIEFRIRELYFDRFFDHSDLRLGHQNILWGRADGGFITDIISPVDLREFLTQDPEDLRTGISAVNLTRYVGSDSFQFILAPVFQPDLIPDPESRWFPLEPLQTPLPVRFQTYDKKATLKEIQMAVRYGLRSPSWLDLDLMLMNWTHPLPTYAVSINLTNNLPEPPGVDLTETYQQSLMGGMSAMVYLHPRLSLTAEALFVKEKAFTFLPVPVSLLEEALNDFGSAIRLLQEFEIRDDGYITTKPWLNAMAGVQTEWMGTTVSVQGYLEAIVKYEEKILSERFFPYLTILAARAFLRDRLQMISISRYNMYGEDIWFQMQGIYELSDGLEIAVGTNLFGGEPVSPFYGHFSFSHFRQNSFLFSRIAYYF